MHIYFFLEFVHPFQNLVLAFAQLCFLVRPVPDLFFPRTPPLPRHDYTTPIPLPFSSHPPTNIQPLTSSFPSTPLHTPPPSSFLLPPPPLVPTPRPHPPCAPSVLQLRFLQVTSPLSFYLSPSTPSTPNKPPIPRSLIPQDPLWDHC